MNAKLVFPLLALFLAGCASSDVSDNIKQNDNAPAADDLVLKAKGWWGLSSADFIAKSGLKPGEYSMGSHPSKQNTTVIMPAVNHWNPPQLSPMEFDFEPAKGLVSIGGFLRSGDTQASVEAVIASRYGGYTKTSAALSFTTHSWAIDGSMLEITAYFFSLVPASN